MVVGLIFSMSEILGVIQRKKIKIKMCYTYMITTKQYKKYVLTTQVHVNFLKEN